MTYKVIDTATKTLWGTFIDSGDKLLEFCRYLEKSCKGCRSFIILEVDTSKMMRFDDFMRYIRGMDEESFKQSAFYLEPDEKEGKVRRKRRMKK